MLLWAVTYLPGATLEDAYVTEAAQPTSGMVWQLGNARIRLEVTSAAGKLLLTKLVNPQSAAEWTPPEGTASMSQLVAVRVGGKEYRLDIPDGDEWRLTSHREVRDEKTVGLELIFESVSPRPRLEVSLHYRVYPHSFIETWTEIRNLNREPGLRIEALRVGRSRIVFGAGAHEYQIADERGTKYGEPLYFEWVTLGPGNSVVLPEQGSLEPSGLHGFVRGFIVKRDTREALVGGVYYGHRSPLGFGAVKSVRFERSEDGKSIGVEIEDGSEDLGEKREVLRASYGQSVKGLTFVYTFAEADLTAISQAYHELARSRMPPPPVGSQPAFPWVESNMYFGYDLGFNARRLKQDVDIAAELGAEVYVIDAGWWEGALAKCETVTSFSDYLIRVGEYTPDFSSRFPSSEVTFKEFSAYVHAKGMRFGLWLCPFNVDPRHQPTGWDPSWLAGDGQHLCASHRPAFDWVRNKISRLVEEYHVDFLKFDCETAARCEHPNHETVRRVGSKEYVITAHDGYSDLITALREAHPGVAMESGPLLGHVQASTDDWDLSPERGRAELQKARFLNPPQYSAQYLMLEPAQEKGTSLEEYRAYTNYVVRSNILGHVILSSELAAWRPRFRSLVKRHVQIYRDYRAAFTGRTYELAFDSGWEVTQFQDPSSTSSIVMSFKKAGGKPERSFPLRGLQPEQMYEVSFEDRDDVLKLTGKQLMADGVRLSFPFSRGSEITYVLPTPCSASALQRRTECEDKAKREVAAGLFPRALRWSGGEMPDLPGSDSLQGFHAPYLKSADVTGHTVVIRQGSDLDPDTYDLGFDGNVGTMHVPLTRLSKACPKCVPPPTHCTPGVWNCQQCPHFRGMPGHPDSDADGLPDWWEGLFGKDMKPSEDTDGDGLVNSAEYWHMTDPLSADTDSDGWSDTLELDSFGTDPLRRETSVRVLYVDPEAEARGACGAREKPCGNVSAVLKSEKFEGSTLVLVASGTLKESLELRGELADGSSLSLLGGFDPHTWERKGGGTTLQAAAGEPALRLAPRASHHGRIAVEGFTVKGGMLIEVPTGGETSFRISRNRIVGASTVPGVEIRGNALGQVQLFNNFISENKGGITGAPTWLLVMNCTIVNNQGPGIAIAWPAKHKPSVWASSINNVLWGNSDDLVGMTTVVATLCQGESRCIPWRDTKRGNLQHQIPDPGVLRDSGVSVPDVMPLLDLDGNPREVGGAVDLGAIEFPQ